MDDYLHDISVINEYAALNRQLMIEALLPFFGVCRDSVRIETCVHNYIEPTGHRQGVLRKGAISAKSGEFVIIPLNMRDGIIIGRGKGNPDWLSSGPHGAGRLMSRTKAKKEISLDDFEATMKEAGVRSLSINEGTLDEAPFAYKPAQEIIDAIRDTVEIEEVIRPFFNFKSN